MPKPAVDLPLPLPVWTMIKPRSSVLVAMILSRAAFFFAIFSAWRTSGSIGSGVSVMSVAPDGIGRNWISGPKTPVDGFQEATGEFAQGRRILFRHEVAHRIIGQKGLVGGIEMAVTDSPCGGGKGEHVVDRGGDLEGSL